MLFPTLIMENNFKVIIEVSHDIESEQLTVTAFFFHAKWINSLIFLFFCSLEENLHSFAHLTLHYIFDEGQKATWKCSLHFLRAPWNFAFHSQLSACFIEPNARQMSIFNALNMPWNIDSQICDTFHNYSSHSLHDSFLPIHCSWNHF